jgi:hypothetical protein
MGGEDSPLPLIYTQMKKQTAVEILVDTIFNEVDLKDSILKLAISQAKELEKQQMKDFVTTFLSSASPAVNSFIRDEFEKYYNETYNNTQS